MKNTLSQPKQHCPNPPRNTMKTIKWLPHKTLFALNPALPPPIKLAPPTRPASVAQRKQVDIIFADDIRSGVEPRKKRVVALMRTNIVLRALTNSQPHVKRVLNRVRYLFDNRSIVDPYELPEEPAEKRTAKFVADIPERPPSTIKSGRVEWTAEETEAIQEALTFWTKVPTNQEIQAMFKKSNVLREIFHRNTFERIHNKVKNEYQRLKK